MRRLAGRKPGVKLADRIDQIGRFIREKKALLEADDNQYGNE